MATKAKMEALVQTLPIGVAVSEYPSGFVTMINKTGIILSGRNVDPKERMDKYARYL